MPEETYSNDGAICPYCGHLNDPENSDYLLYEEELCTWECMDCEREFKVCVYKWFSWTCEAMDE